MIIGIIMILIGVILLPFGISSFKKEIAILKDKSTSKKIAVGLVEIIDIFSFDNYLTWLLSISVLLILSGSVFVYFSL